MNKKRDTYHLSEELLDKAKAMYMDYRSLSYIADTIGVAKSTIQYHAKKKWNSEREMQKAELFAAMTDSKRVQFTSMTAATIQIMERALKSLASRTTPPTMQEATKAAEIMNTLDRITRLDDGSATDIVSTQEKPLTVEVIKEKISLDPFEEPKKLEKIK